MLTKLLAFAQAYPKLFGNPNSPAKAKYLPLIALVYLILPLDLVPDFFPLLGQLDDIGIIILLISMAMNAYEASQKHKKPYPDAIDVTPK